MECHKMDSTFYQIAVLFDSPLSHLNLVRGSIDLVVNHVPVYPAFPSTRCCPSLHPIAREYELGDHSEAIKATRAKAFKTCNIMAAQHSKTLCGPWDVKHTLVV